MSQKAGEFLRHDPIKLRFTTTHATNGSAKSVLKRSLNQSIQEIMVPSYVNPTTTVILYEKLDVSIVELETKRSLKIIWTGIHNKEEASYPFLLPKTSSVHDLADHLAKQVTLTTGGTGKIRVFEVSKDGKFQKEFTGSEMIGNIPEPVELYAEVWQRYFIPKSDKFNFVKQEIPRDELEADETTKVISVFHFNREVARTHGVPFRFVVRPVGYFHLTMVFYFDDF
jgi:ubiquitin carboxyl-terminal hydrolase 7